MNYYMFSCKEGEEYKLESIYNEYLEYLQYEKRNHRISGFLIKKSSTNAKDLKTILNMVNYKGDPFEMYKKRERSTSMVYFGSFKPRHLLKAEPKRKRISKKQRLEMEKENNNFSGLKE